MSLATIRTICSRARARASRGSTQVDGINKLCRGEDRARKQPRRAAAPEFDLIPRTRQPAPIDSESEGGGRGEE
jgi:hypothetical protein